MARTYLDSENEGSDTLKTNKANQGKCSTTFPIVLQIPAAALSKFPCTGRFKLSDASTGMNAMLA